MPKRSSRATVSIPTATLACYSGNDNTGSAAPCHAVVIDRSDERRGALLMEECLMLRVYRRQNDRLAPTDLEVTSHSPPTEAAGALWLDLINQRRAEDHFARTPRPERVPA